MSYRVDDTIVAIASAPGGAARGVIRLSGPLALDVLASCFRGQVGDAIALAARPMAMDGAFHLTDPVRPLVVPCRLLAWPTARSYTRQPSAELHAIGSPPLLGAMVDELVRLGARPAQPGEFTLRAFLGGRIDLTQAEGVLGAIDARNRAELDSALEQLAGGLSRPLHRLREELLAILAELEAGLDFVDEDIEFISRESIREKLTDALDIITAAIEQCRTRDVRTEAPRVALTGAPNVGKSRLFNALIERFGESAAAPAIVSPHAGATRDYLVARVNLGGVTCELVDTAGVSEGAIHPIEVASQHAARQSRRIADVQLLCCEPCAQPASVNDGTALLVVTKCDLLAESDRTKSEGIVICSAVTGEGLDALAAAVAARLRALAGEGSAGVAASTAARCAGSLREAERALAAALDLVDDGGEELLSAEIRAALDALGEVVGAVCADDVLDRIFSQFCIGK